MSESIKIENGKTYAIDLPCGQLELIANYDPLYPGLDIEFTPSNETEPVKTKPRVLIEQPIDTDTNLYKDLRVLVWNDPDSEDYSDKIEFNNTGGAPAMSFANDNTFIIQSDFSDKPLVVARSHDTALVAFYHAVIDLIMWMDENYLIDDQPYAEQMRAALGDVIDDYRNDYISASELKPHIKNWIGTFAGQSVMPPIIYHFCATHEDIRIADRNGKGVPKERISSETYLCMECMLATDKQYVIMNDKTTIDYV
jgi:hypothetical protein